MTFLCFLEAQYPIFRHFFRDLYEIMLFITNPANLSWNLWKIVRFEDILRLDILRPFFWAAQKFLSYNRFLRKQSGPIRTQSALRLRQFIWDCICRTVWRVDFFQLIFSVDFFSVASAFSLTDGSEAATGRYLQVGSLLACPKFIKKFRRTRGVAGRPKVDVCGRRGWGE